MDGYKKIIKSKNVRYGILSALRFIPDKPMVQLQYRIKLKRFPNLKNPRRFTEKIQWYKLCYKDPLMVRCSDKFTARDYVREKGLGHILTQLHGVFDRPEDIRLDALPEKFVLKLSNGSGTNLICRDKTQLDQQDVIRRFREYLFQVNANPGREWPYLQSRPVIIAEELLEDPSHINNAVNDYKIFCYDGRPEYVICISDRYSHRCNHLVYDTGWNKIPVASEGARIQEDAPRPENLPQLLDTAAKLSEDFPFARVDLYSLNNRIYFGEITFFPWSGYMEFQPDDFDFTLGEKFVLRKGG